jgi:hypothetical protein
MLAPVASRNTPGPPGWAASRVNSQRPPVAGSSISRTISVAGSAALAGERTAGPGRNCAQARCALNQSTAETRVVLRPIRIFLSARFFMCDIRSSSTKAFHFLQLQPSLSFQPGLAISLQYIHAKSNPYFIDFNL